MNTNEQVINLFEEIKQSLNITWSDEITDTNVKNHILEGIGFLQNDVKNSIDFTKDIEAKKLLKTYCRYARNNSEEYFVDNNLSEILKLEVKYAKDELQQNE